MQTHACTNARTHACTHARTHYLSGAGLPRFSWKKRPLNVCVGVCCDADTAMMYFIAVRQRKLTPGRYKTMTDLTGFLVSSINFLHVISSIASYLFISGSNLGFL